MDIMELKTKNVTAKGSGSRGCGSHRVIYFKAYFCRFALIMGQGIKNVVPHVVRFLYRIIKLYNVLSVTGSLEREHITLKARGIFAFFLIDSGIRTIFFKPSLR